MRGRLEVYIIEVWPKINYKFIKLSNYSEIHGNNRNRNTAKLK